MIKKLMILMGMLLLMITSVAADVYVPMRFVDENANTFAGITNVQVYNRYSEDNIQFWKEYTTLATDTGVTVQLPTTMPAGVQDYLVYFFRNGYLPYLAETDYQGNGNVDEFPVPLVKKKNAIAPIREFTIESIYPEQPLVFSIDAEADGKVFSALRLNNEITDYVPAGKEDFYSVDTTVEVRIIDPAFPNSPVFQSATAPLSLFAGEWQSFDFSIPAYTMNPGYYNVIAESTIVDNQVDEATKETGIQTSQVRVMEDLEDVTLFSFPSGITTSPINPTQTKQEIKVYGTKISNLFSEGLEVPISAELEFRVYQNGIVIFEDMQTVPAGEDLLDAVEFEFFWTPLELGDYEIEVKGYTTKI